MRGLTVVGMIVVNFCMIGAGYRDFAIYPMLAHADWAGFTFADFVFPAFIFMVGVSIALATRGSPGLELPTGRAIAARTVRLFVVGFVLTNLLYQWMHGWSFSGFRLMGVLQRISLCYAAAALLQHRLSERGLLALASITLILYWPLTLMPIPGGAATNLWTPGTNFVSWVDRAVLGSHIWVDGPTGYDSEGLLSTLPAMAQCILGVVAGRRLASPATRKADLFRIALVACVAIVAGLVWGMWFPIVKSIWTSSFVLLSTGLAMLLLALIQRLLNSSAMPSTVAKFLEAFGVNAILAYVLHSFCYFALALGFIPAVYHSLATLLPPALANLVIACMLTLLIWCVLAIMYWRHWRVRI